MGNQKSGGSAGIAVLAVLAVLGVAGGFVYKTVFLDSRGPASASASPAAAPSPSASASPSDSNSAGAPATGSPKADAPPTETPQAEAPASDAPASGGAPSGVGRALSGLRKLVSSEAKESREEAARLSSLASTIWTLRSQVALYKLQHNDNSPDFGKYPGAEQLTRPTYEDGAFAEGRAVDEDGRPLRRFGPYMQSMVPNPLNNAVAWATVDGDVNEGDTVTPPPGFDKVGYVFSTSRGTVWATDATGLRVADVDAMIARQKSSTPAGRQELFTTTHQTLASQLQLYRLQHNDQVPDFTRYPKWEQLLNKTDANGTVSPRGSIGPYLVRVPVNPHNGFSAVEVVDQDPPAGFKPKGRNVGWVVNSESGFVWGTDAKGLVIPR